MIPCSTTELPQLMLRISLASMQQISACFELGGELCLWLARRRARSKLSGLRSTRSCLSLGMRAAHDAKTS